MDKNAITGLLLIGLLLIGYTWYNAPSQEQIAADKVKAEQAALSAAAAENTPAAATLADPALLVDTLLAATEAALPDSVRSALASARQTALQAKYGLLATAAEGTETFTTIRNEHLEVTFSNKGGMPVAARLLHYQTYTGEPLYLFRESNHNLGFRFVYPSLGRFHTGDFFFTPTATPKAEVAGDDHTSISYTLTTPDGRSIQNTWTIGGDAFDIALSTRFRDMDGIFADGALTWELAAEHIEKGIAAERNNSTIFYKELDRGRDYLSETSDDDETVDRALEWVAFKQHFFSLILMQQQDAEGVGQPFGKNARLETRPFETEESGSDTLTQYYFAEIPVGESPAAFNARLYIGPNDYATLRTYGMETDKVINLGWGIFGWVNRFLVIPIFDWLQGTGMSYGIIILILTLIIKMLLGPLTWKNYLSSAKMRVLKPEIDAINEKHKDGDAMKKQQATMELYRKTGVSPFAGCLPMIVQLPILYAMFRFFPNAIQLRHEPFLWADDLSSFDSIATLPFTIPAYGDHVSLFTLLMAASTFLYTMFNSSNMPAQQPGMPNMKVIMYIFPFMMLFFFNSFASSLSYYYFLANLTSLLQMWFIKRFMIDEEKIKAKIDENKKKRGKLPKSKFQQKLEDMAKQRGISTK